MTAATTSARHDAQAALTQPAAVRATAINTALADLYEVAQQDVRLGKASPEVWTAVCAVSEAKR
jgi:hypothetical protein